MRGSCQIISVLSAVVATEPSLSRRKPFPPEMTATEVTLSLLTLSLSQGRPLTHMSGSSLSSYMEPSSMLCSKDSKDESEASSPLAVNGRPGKPEVERRRYCSNIPPRPFPLPSTWVEIQGCWRDSWEDESLRPSNPQAESCPSTIESRFRRSGDKLLERATKKSTGPQCALRDVIPLPVPHWQRVQIALISKKTAMPGSEKT